MQSLRNSENDEMYDLRRQEMITLKYEKKYPFVYVSHIDVLRGMVRIIRRTGFIPEFSKGFNPHMLLFFSPPLAVGVASECEYVTADISGVDEKEFLEAFNKSCPAGVRATASYVTEKNPNLAGNIAASDYLFPVKDPARTAEIVSFFEKCDKYTIEFTQKKEIVEKEVRGQIKAVKPVNGGITFTLATGNDNLRADRLLAGLKKDFEIETENTDILKIAQYVAEGGGYTNADEYLKRG